MAIPGVGLAPVLGGEPQAAAPVAESAAAVAPVAAAVGRAAAGGTGGSGSCSGGTGGGSDGTVARAGPVALVAAPAGPAALVAGPAGPVALVAGPMAPVALVAGPVAAVALVAGPSRRWWWRDEHPHRRSCRPTAVDPGISAGWARQVQTSVMRGVPPIGQVGGSPRHRVVTQTGQPSGRRPAEAIATLPPSCRGAPTRCSVASGDSRHPTPALRGRTTLASHSPRACSR